MNLLLRIDNTVLNSIYALKNPFLDFLMPAATSLGDDGIIWIVICVCCLIFKKTRKCGITIAIALLINLFVTNLILKNLFMRIRPFEANGIMDLLINIPTDYSFPSGHSSSSFAAATVVFMYFKKTGISALVLAFLISFSRLYLYVHYPSDVFCGIIIGIIAAVVSKAAVDKFFNKKRNV